jgi:hypothetical protein
MPELCSDNQMIKRIQLGSKGGYENANGNLVRVSISKQESAPACRTDSVRESQKLFGC